MLQKLFGFDKKVMTLRTEIIAGITTFLTMSYILAVNPTMLGTTGMDKGAVFTATALPQPLPLFYWRVWQNYRLRKLPVWD